MVDDAYCAASLPALASYGDRERNAFNGSEARMAKQKQSDRNKKVQKQCRTEVLNSSGSRRLTVATWLC